MSEHEGPPIESERRREEFRGDVPIVLCDGQTWHLPRPRVAGQYMAADGPRTIECAVTEFGPEYDWRAEEAIIEHLNANLKNPAIDWFGRFLLRRNYTLSDRDFYYLLRFIPGDQQNMHMWIEIISVALDRIFIRNDADPKAPGPADPSCSSGP